MLGARTRAARRCDGIFRRLGRLLCSGESRALATFWEWMSLMADAHRRGVMIMGAVALALAVALAACGHVVVALTAVAAGAVGVAALAPRECRIWLAAGVPYCGSIAVVPVVLRSDPEFGFLAMIFLFAIVWGTDTVAYFLGRAIGGSKLMPRVSPKKTWSGALAGTAAAIVAALLIARTAGLTGTFVLVVLATVLSVSSQARRPVRVRFSSEGSAPRILAA